MIRPNGAGSSTFFDDLRKSPTYGKILFEGRDITGRDVTDACRLGFNQSYQVDQLRAGDVAEPDVAALAMCSGKFKLDLFAIKIDPRPRGADGRAPIWCSSPSRNTKVSI